jgi:sialate O-acetylesterase
VLVREAMLKSLVVPKTGMAVALGLGDAKDIHPRNKRGVGERLAKWALAHVHGAESGAESPGMGPVYAGHTVAGAEVTVRFAHAAGLMAKDGEVKGFVVAGEDRQWKPATARIADGAAVVSSPEVAVPVAVRYAWAGNPEFSIFNRAGLPASPFRTDDWPVTEASIPPR